jgi:endonuclease-3
LYSSHFAATGASGDSEAHYFMITQMKKTVSRGKTPMTKKEKLQHILETLDKIYGTTKDGFYHNQDWQLLTAIMLSAQSTDKQVDEALPGLFGRFRTAEEVAQAPVEEIEEYIRSVGLYKNKAKNMKKCCEQLVKDYGGKVPDKLEEVLKLAGVGRKTATLFLADAYGIPGVTVDTHVFRISHRLGWAKGKNPEQTEQELMKVLPKDHWNRINFQLIYLGREICTARKAKCTQCPLQEWCEKNL